MPENPNFSHKAFTLVTTALEESWPKSGRILFLGEWCRLHSRTHIWSKLDHEVLPYHWDDREKLHADFRMLQKLNDQLIVELAQNLNEIHDVNRSITYWRILLGYWLNLFTAVIFDRWSMIRNAIEDGRVLESIKVEIPLENVTANDSVEFNRLIVDDVWNHYICAQLLEGWTDVPLAYVDRLLRSENNPESPASKKNRAKDVMKHQHNRVLSRFSKDDSYFFISTYLPIGYDLGLQLKLGQLPKMWRLPSLNVEKVSHNLRAWCLKSGSGPEILVDILSKLIPKQIPRVFLEGYQSLCKLIESFPWPRRPKLLFTSNAHFSNDTFKAWAGAKTEMGSKLVIGEHGGYQVGLFNGGGSFQWSICDALISWGADGQEPPKIKPFGILRTIGKKQKWDPKGLGLMVEVAMPRYSFDMRSMVIASQMLKYFEDQFRFYESLPEAIQENLVIRLYPQDNKWCQTERWKDRFPQVKLALGETPIKKQINKSRIYISTYNATTYLESLSLNVPTLMFWNPQHWELREEAVPYFDLLKEVGIYHEYPESAAKKLAEIWEDVFGWWNGRRIQETRAYFCHRFAKKIKRPVSVLKKLLMAEAS